MQSFKHIFQVFSVFFCKSIRLQLQVPSCLLSGVTSVDLVKFGVVRLKTLLLSPPTTTWAPNKGTNTARLCSVMATRESLVSLIPNKICNRENRKQKKLGNRDYITAELFILRGCLSFWTDYTSTISLDIFTHTHLHVHLWNVQHFSSALIT